MPSSQGERKGRPGGRPGFDATRLEDELQTKKEPPLSDAISDDISGKGGTAIGVEVGILERAAGGVVQNWVRNTTEHRVHNVVRRGLKLSRDPFRDIDVFEYGKIGGTDGSSAQCVAADPGERRSIKNRRVRVIVNPVHRTQCCWRAGYEIGECAGRSACSRASKLANGCNRGGWVRQDRPTCIVLAAKIGPWVAKATVTRIPFNCRVRLSSGVAIGCIYLPAAQHATCRAVLVFVKGQIIDDGDAHYIWEIGSRISSFRSASSEWILRLGQSIATSDRAEYLAGVIDCMAPGIRSGCAHAVKVSRAQFGLQAVVARACRVGILNYVREIAVNISRRKTWRSRSGARRQTCRNYVRKSRGDQRTQFGVSVQCLEKMDSVVAHVSNFAHNSASEQVLYSDIPLFRIGVSEVGADLRLIGESWIPDGRKRLQVRDYLSSEETSGWKARPENVARFTAGAEVATFRNML